ncbi:hypothetical protein QCE49_33075 [Caballeronia sp. LZ008]|uniref:hypothetical protein n=1 Tax=unclassified Caballeronia TaxID=2646786 RepID=UPI0020287C84|nr:MULTISPECIES: hypothetical protein [unclassified Caballeronia]MDR5798234.1 hypothetical protein [Caballeronia sp. LZ008]
MPRHSDDTNRDPSARDAQVLRALRNAAVSAVLFDYRAACALLRLSDAEVGRLFKIRLMHVAGLSTALNLDLRSIRDLPQAGPPESEHPTSPHRHLVAEGKLLRASHFRLASGVTKKKLRKDVASGRIFKVTIEGRAFYPAFFLVRELDRKSLSKLARRLASQTGWRRWEFFTSPNVSLCDLTPLQALISGEFKPVLRAAAAFIHE